MTTTARPADDKIDAGRHLRDAASPGVAPDDVDPRRNLAELYAELGSSPSGLTAADVVRATAASGSNELVRRAARRWPAQVLEQCTQPLVILLAVAAVLAFVGGTPALSAAVIAVIVLNAAFALIQERQAEQAVEALAGFLPATARVRRDGSVTEVPARDLVPGDILLVTEGERLPADARIIDGSVMVDLSALTGESLSASRNADATDQDGPLLEATNVVFSGTTCTGGEATTLVTNTGMHSELGRIATLSQQGKPEPSPLEVQVRRATIVIAIVAVIIGVAFLPVGLAAGLGWSAAISFSIGLLVANVPEGLLPTITLALAVGVRELAKKGAVVKRLSAVETLGSVTVICTDKTGTLTENRMTVTRLWLRGAELDAHDAGSNARAVHLALTAAACTSAEVPTDAQPKGIGDPTEVALLVLASDLGSAVLPAARAAQQLQEFRFDPHVGRMTTVTRIRDARIWVHTNGAPESVLVCCTSIDTASGTDEPLDGAARAEVQSTLDGYAARGLRVLAIAQRRLSASEAAPSSRDEAEQGLTLLGLVAMVDPPRSGVAEAVAAAHTAGIRIHVITGDYGPTAAEIASKVGIGAAPEGQSRGRIVTGNQLAALDDDALGALFSTPDEFVFARTSPEGKLRICQALRAHGEVVAMTGDGVNDAPALRHADIGVAMGRSGTDVAREAATMVLTDDNFATIVSAVDAGRRVFDNVRKFVLYIFAHAVPEVIPFLVFALSGGSIPLPLTVLQILAIDLGTETLPALALGRETAESGLMSRPPRPRGSGVIDKALLLRAWGLLGAISAILVMAGFFITLHGAGWHLNAPTGNGAALHHAYLQATSITFAGIVACQIGTAFAARTDHASLRSIGVLSNPLLLWGIAFELVFTAAVIYLPVLQDVFGTANLGLSQLAVIVPFPFIVWGADETVRWLRRRHVASGKALKRPLTPTTEPAAATV